MKHLICIIDRNTGVHTITTPDGYVVLRKEPTSVYVAHREAWSNLTKLYSELVIGEELAN